MLSFQPNEGSEPGTRIKPTITGGLLTADQPEFGVSVLRFRDRTKRPIGSRATEIQLHNSVTSRRGDLPTSVAVEDVLGSRGVVPAFQSLHREGRIHAFGFTGLSEHRALRELIQSGVFTSTQVPLSLLTPHAGQDRSAGSIDVDWNKSPVCPV